MFDKIDHCAKKAIPSTVMTEVRKTISSLRLIFQIPARMIIAKMVRNKFIIRCVIRFLFKSKSNLLKNLFIDF
jgi:hypothetical protein